MIQRRRLNLIGAVGQQPLCPVTSPNFRVRVYTAQKQQFSCGAPADENDASSSAHDSRYQLWNFRIWEGMLAVGSERRKRAVVIKQQRARRRTPQAIKKCGAHILVYCD